ncbi:MAG: hypothetical protein SFV51_05215 [Bryobacteraceae bacterium]|nr:hypothetical protein [Bryobacteraceae bacterium]
MVGGAAWGPSADVPVLLAGEVHLWFAIGEPDSGLTALRFLLGEYLGRRPQSFRIEQAGDRLLVPGFPIACGMSESSGARLLGFTPRGHLGVALERLRSDIPYSARGLTQEALSRVRLQPPQRRNEAAVWECCRQRALRQACPSAVLLPVPPIPGFAAAVAVDRLRALRTFQYAPNGLR